MARKIIGCLKRSDNSSAISPRQLKLEVSSMITKHLGICESLDMVGDGYSR